MSFTLTNLFNISVVSSVLTLIIYHFFIYLGRRGSGNERLYYIYFCLFATNFLLYLLCVSSLHQFIFPNEKIRRIISPAITGVSFFLMLHYVIKTFKIIFRFPTSKNKALLPFYIPFVFYFILLSSYPFLDYNYYIENIFSIEAYLSTAATAYMFILFVIYFFRSKTLKKDLPSKIILFIFFIFMTDFFMEEMFTIIGLFYPFKGTYFISGISVLIWAYALAIRFNNEHNELRQLKINLEEKVKERTLQLQLANEQRTNTFIELAHETRTPLTLIKNNLDDYSQKHDDNTEIDRIKFNVEKINKLIGNILDIEKFGKGHDIYRHNEVIDFSSFVSTKIDYFRPYTAKKNLKITSEIQKNIFVKASPIALESLLDNLIFNAVKFTFEGGVTIRLFSENGSVILSIKDTGVGIPADIHEKIFEPYYRSPNSPVPGFGMGLAIVKGIIGSLNADIALNSKEGEGSQFIVSLNNYQLSNTDKICKEHKTSPAIVENTEAVISDAVSMPDKPFILIIEDHHELLLYLRDKLKDEYNIYIAINGNKALEKIRECTNKPDLIISDVMMGSMDGVEFYNVLKKSAYNFIPLIYITAKANSKDRDKALGMGAIDYIYKPFEISEVRKKVASILNNSRKQQSLAISNINMIIESEASRLRGLPTNEQDSFESNCELYKITNREKDVIKLAYKGRTYIEIASDLDISKKTVDNHFQNIYKKVSVNRIQDLLQKLYLNPVHNAD